LLGLRAGKRLFLIPLEKTMKNRILSGGGAALLGLLIAFGPLFIFKPCGLMGDSYSHCHWSIQGDMAAGLMIAALGA
jgi:hypothetical protein